MKILSPKRIKRSYTQSLVAPPEKVFPLLCPVRERDWVPDWDPELVLSNSGIAEADCVFITRGSPQQTTWVITRYDPQGYTLEILKVTQNHTVGKLEIALAGDGDGGTSAEVSYTYTSVGPEGDAFLEEFTEAWYRDFMERWERTLNHYLSTGEKLSRGV